MLSFVSHQPIRLTCFVLLWAASSPFFHPESIAPTHQMISDQPADSSYSAHCFWEGQFYHYHSLNMPPSSAKQICTKVSDFFLFSPFTCYEIFKVQLQLHISAISLLYLPMHLRLILNSSLFLTSVK